MGKLHTAAKKGDLTAVQDALSAGAEVDEQNEEEQTALHVAAAEGHTKVLEFLLLEKEADPDVEDEEGNTALHLAAANGHLEAVKVLLEKSDEDAEDEQGNTPAYVALRNGRSACARHLVEEVGASVELACEDGATLLHLAANLGDAGFAQLLLDKGAPVDALDRWRYTPLISACKAGAWEVGSLLLSAKADAKAVGKDQWTPLHFCAQNSSGAEGAVDFAEKLLESGASAAARTRDGLPPAMVVGLDAGKRSRRQQDADDEMRALLEDAAKGKG